MKKHLRSVRKDLDTLDVRRQVSLCHSVHLRILDVCYRGRYKSSDAALGLAPERLTLIYRQASCFITISSTIYCVCSDSNPYAGQHICTFKLVKEGHIIVMVALVGGTSQNSSSRYPIISRSKEFDVRTSNDGMIQNLNPDFNTIRLQTIMKYIQRIAPKCSPLVALAQQGVEVANVVAVQRSAVNPRGKPSVGNRSNNRRRRARSEAAASVSGNCRLADNDAQRQITQNCYL
jgi:hypothetical protein